MDSLSSQTTADAGEALWETVRAIRAARPLVHNITNAVVANTTANALLALGASPAMADAPEEVAELVRAADALVINLGTVNAAAAEAMHRAVDEATATATPWILDPVAVGALGYRSRLAGELIARRPAAIRGNASEILALSGQAAAGKGVDSAHTPDEALAAAEALARATGAAVAVTGPVDVVTDGARRLSVAGGHETMTRVTGMGCTATALIGACLAVRDDPLDAAAHGLALTAIAGELAARSAAGPGSLQIAFLDRLYGLDRETARTRARIA